MIYFATEIHRIQSGTDNPVITKVRQKYRLPTTRPQELLEMPQSASSFGGREVIFACLPSSESNINLSRQWNRKPISLGDATCWSPEKKWSWQDVTAPEISSSFLEDRFF